ncbi:MAG: hypothetical protein KKC51_02985, partial [Verrucomicrobia bacterium]|nr:hypothetical protein [Verrucomicrobiota bacterium]
MKVGAKQRLATVFSLGFFALVAQSLLFREFFSVFEGNELGFGCFFSSWLLWVGAGALVARSLTRAVHKLTDFFEWLPLVYLPAFILQLHLVQHARMLAGVQPFELFPLAKMFPVAMLANAPVSFVTGLLFTIACAWLSGAGGLPPARVYFFEALGGGAGGVAVTAALAAGWPAETIFLVLAVANSSLATRFHDLAFNNKLYSARRRYITQYVAQYPLPDCGSKPSRRIMELTQRIC